MKIAEFDIGLGRSEGEVIKENDKTIIVRLRRAGNTAAVKRHIDKHNVVIIEEAPDER